MAICMAGIKKLSGIKSAIKKSSINGVVIRQANEVNVVILMESGTLPRAKSVKIFDTVPPGIEAIRAGLAYTSDAADDPRGVDFGRRRLITILIYLFF